jgi:hypothetical protein
MKKTSVSIFCSSCSFIENKKDYFLKKDVSQLQLNSSKTSINDLSMIKNKKFYMHQKKPRKEPNIFGLLGRSNDAKKSGNCNVRHSLVEINHLPDEPTNIAYNLMPVEAFGALVSKELGWCKKKRDTTK